MKKIVFAAILWLIVPTSVFAQAQNFTFTKTGPAAGFQNPVIARPHTYDTAPSAIQEGNEIKVWYCGGGQPGDPFRGHDSVYYASYNATTGAVIDAPQRVVWPTLNDANDDGDMACAVTVVKHQNPNIANFSGVMGAPQYKMWYECAPRVYRKSDGQPQGCYTQICHAASDDGIHWQKWEVPDLQGASWRFNQQSTTIENNPVKATAVITIPQKIKDNTGLERRSDGKLYADFGTGACGYKSNYGVGHPTAITLQPESNGFQRIRLWYYDSQGDWNNRALTYVESWDGFHFEAPVKTNIQSPNKIKYFSVPLAGHPGFYLATTGPFFLNIFNYSWDGIHWFWQDNLADNYTPPVSFYTDYLANHFGLGSITGCVIGNGTMVGDQSGDIASLTGVKFLSTEGGMGTADNCTATNGCKCYNPEEDTGGRGNTYDIYTLTGNLIYITPTSTPTPTPIPGDIWGPSSKPDGHVDMYDFNKMRASFGNPYTIYNYNDLVGNFGLPTQAGK